MTPGEHVRQVEHARECVISALVCIEQREFIGAFILSAAAVVALSHVVGKAGLGAARVIVAKEFSSRA